MDQATRPKSDSKLSIAPFSEDAFTASGRREFLAFRDLNVSSSTGGKFGAVVIRAKKGMESPTGWHYHICDTQVIYMLKGWATMAFENGETVTIHEGTCISIPPGFLHNELRTSDNMEALEFTSPAVMQTVPTDPPAAKAAG